MELRQAAHNGSRFDVSNDEPSVSFSDSSELHARIATCSSSLSMPLFKEDFSASRASISQGLAFLLAIAALADRNFLRFRFAALIFSTSSMCERKWKGKSWR